MKSGGLLKEQSNGLSITDADLKIMKEKLKTQWRLLL
jgi:hypothetical protein